jgi:hypothetical protein
MISLTIAVIVAVALNILLGWYATRLLRKFLYISQNISDLFLAFKDFEAFVDSIYKMEILYGEPVIKDLIDRTKVVIEELEMFREVFEYTLDEELEEEINDRPPEIEEEAQKVY